MGCFQHYLYICKGKHHFGFGNKFSSFFIQFFYMQFFNIINIMLNSTFRKR